MSRYWTLWSVWSLAVIALATSPVAAAEPTKDPLAMVKKNVEEKKAVLVDVREKSKWDAGHIADSVLLPLSSLKEGLDAEAIAKQLPKDRIIYTFCVKGIRSCTAADFLKEHGYDVRPLKPGYQQLLDAGFKKGKK